MESDAKLLPITEVGGREFLIDTANKELRDFNNAEYVVKMHSPAGRELISQIPNMEWRVFGLSTGVDKGLGREYSS